MIPNTGHVMTLANSIIGVGILAMPYCFQKCGIILSIVLILLSNIITRISCHYLIKSSLLTRRKSFEFLAFNAFGSSGKLLVELCIIGYLIGTCIAYFVVVGDLGPLIVEKLFSFRTTSENLRLWVMFSVTFLCIIPLGMLKNVDSLSTVCTASIGFYLCLVIKIILESKKNIVANDWQNEVSYWRPAGILQCLPIFSMALSCQMQIFEVFKSINNQSVEKLNGIVKNATWICTWVYISVGLFGYIAFCLKPFSGNILMDFPPTFGSDVMRIGFVLSVAFSFPLVIFPCRASIFSLLYRKGQTDSSAFIPEGRFRAITIFIIISSLLVALIIPSIELVIGLIGSTIGVAICIIFPAACFRHIIKKDSAERTLAQFILVGGCCLMILGTYANLNAIDEKRSGAHLEPVELLVPQLNLPVTPPKIDLLPNKLPVSEPSAENNLNLTVKDPQSPNKVNNIKLQENDQKNVISPEPERQRIPTQPPKPSPVLSKITPKSSNGNGINKEAIAKDEEIAAEEEHKKIDQEKNEELTKTKNELKLTKELLEKKVDELKEAQELVVEKLGEVVQKVEQIEKKVQKEEAIEHKEDPILKLPKEEVKSNNMPVVEILEEVKDKVKEIQMEVKKDASNTKIESQASEKNDSIVIPKDSLIGILTENLKNNSKFLKNNNGTKNSTGIPPVNKVYEPLSYKTGEILTKGEKVKDNTKPLPLALLINSSKIENAPKVEAEVNDKDNIEAIRRDLLGSKNEPSVATTIEEHHIEKRDANDIDENCSKNESPNNLSIETKLIGRDLKSIKEKTN